MKDLIEALSMDNVVLQNNGSPDCECLNLYFPRLMVNKHGEIVLATSKHGSLTSGILVGKTSKSKSKWPIGTKFADWEVVGELKDYDGEVKVQFRNEVSSNVSAQRFP